MERTAIGVSDEDVRAYERDGVVCLRRMFDPETISRAYAIADAFVRKPHASAPYRKIAGKRPDGSTAQDDPPSFFMASFSRARGNDRHFEAIASDPRCAEIAARLMRVDEVRYFYSQLFVKDPLADAPTQWHQDMPFWPFDGEHIVSLWIALLPVSKESGGVEYLAGSHRWGRFYRATTPDEDPARADPSLEPCPDFDDAEYRNDPALRFLSWSLEPGDVVCHHPLTIHGAGGNASPTQRRAGLSIRYFGADVRWQPRPYAASYPLSVELSPGDYPADDRSFPVIARAGAMPPR